jgi:hypothetical protein
LAEAFWHGKLLNWGKLNQLYSTLAKTLLGISACWTSIFMEIVKQPGNFTGFGLITTLLASMANNFFDAGFVQSLAFPGMSQKGLHSAEFTGAG